MNTTVVNVRVNPVVKRKAKKLAGQIGVSLSDVINNALRYFIQTKKITFSTSYEPSDYLIKSLKESKKNIKEGWVSPSFDNANDAIAWLNNPKRKYERQIRKKVHKTI